MEHTLTTHLNHTGTICTNNSLKLERIMVQFCSLTSFSTGVLYFYAFGLRNSFNLMTGSNALWVCPFGSNFRQCLIVLHGHFHSLISLQVSQVFILLLSGVLQKLSSLFSHLDLLLFIGGLNQAAISLGLALHQVKIVLHELPLDLLVIFLRQKCLSQPEYSIVRICLIQQRWHEVFRITAFFCNILRPSILLFFRLTV
jgi:hypothetical protein